MAVNGDRSDVRRTIRSALAATCACTDQNLIEDGVVVTLARELPGRLRFPVPAKPLLAVTMGAGVVVSCHPERVSWVHSTLGRRTRDAIFTATTIGEIAHYVRRGGQYLAGPDLKYACSRADLRPAVTPHGIAIALVEGADISALYAYRGYEDALTYRPGSPRPTMLAAVATRAGTVVGMAGASADTDDLWQIGVAVAEAERGRGIGRALVSQLTEDILARDKIPYYTAAVSNIHSRAIATSLGYWPAWTELYAREH